MQHQNLKETSKKEWKIYVGSGIVKILLFAKKESK